MRLFGRVLKALRWKKRAPAPGDHLWNGAIGLGNIFHLHTRRAAGAIVPSEGVEESDPKERLAESSCSADVALHRTTEAQVLDPILSIVAPAKRCKQSEEVEEHTEVLQEDGLEGGLHCRPFTLLVLASTMLGLAATSCMTCFQTWCWNHGAKRMLRTAKPAWT